MDALSIHLCFKVDVEPAKDEELWNLILSIPSELLADSDPVTVVDSRNGDRMLLTTDAHGSHLILHAYKHGLVTVDLQHSEKSSTPTKSNIFQVIKAMETKLQNILGDRCKFTRSVPTNIRRGQVCPYFLRGDSNSLFEHEPLKLLYEKTSKWQNIKIYKTTSCGNMLCLDDEITILDAILRYFQLGYLVLLESILIGILVIKAMETKLQNILGDRCKFTRSVPTNIRRGQVCPYFLRGDSNSLFEHEPLKLLYEKTSKWQNIKIYKTTSCGNMLCLDDEIMLSEADNIYTHTLLGMGRNDFRDTTVLILGGGDGGLLHELLKHAPKFVHMVEIDMEVIKACCQHMPAVCGDSLDRLSGDNYKVEIANCITVLKECQNQSRTFDYVINDLSEYLIDTDIGFDYDYKTSADIIEMSVSILNPGGKFLSRGNGLADTSCLTAFEAAVTGLGLQFTRQVVDVPSYMEKYCLYEVWKPEVNGV